VRFCFVLRELEQVERPLDVDLVSGDRGEFGARGEQRGEMKDQLDLKLGEHPLQESAVEDGTGDLSIDLRRNRLVEAVEIQRYDRTFRLLAQFRNEPVADFTASAGNEDDRFSHAANYTRQRMRSEMHRWRMALVAGCVVATVAGGAATRPAQSEAVGYDRYFTADTMRVDYFHTGGPKSGETFSLDRVVNDGQWPGSRTQLIDPTDLGPYLFEVRDQASGTPIYSRGFASVYGEWETTSEAKTTHRTFHESLRFPWPKQPVAIALKKRQADNTFVVTWSTDVDPRMRFVNRSPLTQHAGRVWPVFENGPSSQKVDLLVIAEGYTAAEMTKFHGDVRRLVESLFAEEPFRSRRLDFNVRALDVPSAESGIHRPNAGVFRRSPISAEYNIFDSERYVLTLDNRALRDAASAAPYEFIEILVNEKTYGGGGIFNDQATASVDSAFSDYVFVHEFGHHFAALADEYYTSDVAYETGGARKPEPWEPNVTALHDPARLKWRDLVTAPTPLPTPWDKETFEKHTAEIQQRRREIRTRNAPEEEMDALFREQRDWDEKFFASMRSARAVGAFEGAAYEARGLYRPEVDCIMFTRDRVGFCRVCQRAIGRIIDLYAK
jgi:IgA peptidase M64/peptidase M64-like protein